MKICTVLSLCLLLLTACASPSFTEPHNGEIEKSPEFQKTLPSQEQSNAPPESNKVTEPTESQPTAVTEQTDASETENTHSDTVSTLAEDAFLVPYENYSWEREFDVEFVVLHFTSNVVNSKDDPYNMDKVLEIFKNTQVSPHYIIDRDGTIKCCIPENYAAWHAGAGTFNNDEKYTNKMNKYSIGIELLAIGSQNDMSTYLTAAEYDGLNEDLIGFTDEQYSSLKELLNDICKRYGIAYDRQHIIGHDEYNPKKSDPGELFDWEKLFQ